MAMRIYKNSYWNYKVALTCRSLQLRTFINSTALQETNTVPVFTPTSSPELDALLQRMRLKLFLPKYLSAAQQRMISKEKNKRLLENEPAIAKIGEEEFRLEFIDKMDLPPYFKSFKQAIDLMRNESNWDNLPGLLEGCHKVVKGASPIHTDIIRKIAVKAPAESILECIRRVSRTGLRIRSPEEAKWVLFGLQKPAVEANWDRAALGKSLRYSEQLLDLLENTDHQGSKTPPQKQPRNSAEVIGSVLELAAIRAVKYQDGKDIDGKVEKLSKRLLICISNVEPRPLQREDGRIEEWKLNYWLVHTVPLLHGMKLALRVLDPESPLVTMLKLHVSRLEVDVTSVKDELANSDGSRKGPRIWNSVYERLEVEL